MSHCVSNHPTASAAQQKIWEQQADLLANDTKSWLCFLQTKICYNEIWGHKDCLLTLSMSMACQAFLADI